MARTVEHAVESARLCTEMDPDYASALTLTVIPDTPIHRLQTRGKFELPDVNELLLELRTFIDQATPTAAVFRTNHASNYVPLAGVLPKDKSQMVAAIDASMAGKRAMRPEWMRGL